MSPRYGILCISDRMLTSPTLNIEFEQAMKKMYHFDNGTNTTALLAGDTSTQIMLCDRTRVTLAPESPVADVAASYALEYARLRQERNERKHLTPLGLTTDTFAGATGAMSPVLAMQLANDLRWAELGCEALICGTDRFGAHIFVVKDPGLVDCADSVGFASIGIGSPHAETILMDAGYTRNALLSNALLLLYTAKRRAEVAPGVGRETDIAVVSSDRPAPVFVGSAIQNQLEAIYARQKRAEAKVHRAALKAIDRFIVEMFRPPPPRPGSAPAAPAAGGPSPSTPDSSGPPPSPGSDRPPSPAS
jgi:hypothetical protein